MALEGQNDANPKSKPTLVCGGNKEYMYSECKFNCCKGTT